MKNWKRTIFWFLLAVVWAALGWAFYEYIWLATAPGEDGVRGILQFTWEDRDVEVLDPLLLGIGLVVPALWIVRRYTLSDLPKVQQHLSTALRALLILCLVGALSRMVFTTFESKVTTVFLVDTSASMPDEALKAAETHIQEVYNARGEKNSVQIVTFARDARVLPIPPGADKIPPLVRPSEQDELLGSNMQEAMRLAYGLFPQDNIKKVVVISDGNQTDGDLLSETYNARDYGIKVFARTFPFEPRPEVLIKGFQLPENPRVGAPFTLTAEVYSTKEAQASFTLWQNDFKEGTQDKELAPGLNTIEFRTEVYEPGKRRYKLDMKLKDGASVDTFGPNNVFKETIEVHGKPRILYVEGTKRYGRYLTNALVKEKIDVELRDSLGLPSKLSGYENFDAVVLSDVPAHKVSHTKMKTLDAYIKKGGGFMMAGVNSSFGPGGYQKTYMEQILPVTLEGSKKLNKPSLALQLVIDRSGSMQKQQRLEMAKEAAKAAAGVLERNDKIGVIAFDDSPNEVVRLKSASNRSGISSAISRITASGGTNIAPALQQALENLLSTRAAKKHIILLSDGQSDPSNIFSELLPAMGAEGITVTTVAVSREASVSMLKRIARGGDGNFYHVTNPRDLPKIFLKEAHEQNQSLLRDSPFRPRVAKNTQALRGLNMKEAPLLLGYVSTKAKKGAEVFLKSPDGDPVLARTRRGLGKSAAFTSGLKNQWGIQWVRWDKYPKFWAQVLRSLMRTDDNKTLPMTLAIDRGRGRIVVDAIDENDRFINGMVSEITIKPPEGDNQTLTLQQTAPGRYESDFDLEKFGSYVISAIHSDKEGEQIATSRGTLTWPYPDEYLTLAPNETLIAKTAEVGNGVLNPDAKRLFDPEGESVKHKSELWPWFLFAALALLILDILLRRLRLYGKTAIPWEQVVRRR